MPRTPTTALQAYYEAVRAFLFARFGPALGLVDVTKDVVMAPQETALRKIGEIKGRNQVEFVSLWNDIDTYHWGLQSQAAARHGIPVEFTSEEKTDSTTIYAVPDAIGYKFCLWTREPERLFACAEKFLWIRHENPRLLMTMTLGGITVPLKPYMKFDDSLSEQGTAPVEFDKGLYYMRSGSLVLDGWVFKALTAKTILEIQLKFYHANSLTTVQETGADPDAQLLSEAVIVPS